MEALIEMSNIYLFNCLVRYGGFYISDCFCLQIYFCFVLRNTYVNSTLRILVQSV